MANAGSRTNRRGGVAVAVLDMALVDEFSVRAIMSPIREIARIGSTTTGLCVCYGGADGETLK
jgi:hypothetical protein